MRLLLTWLINAAALMALPYLMNSVTVTNIGAALVAARAEAEQRLGDLENSIPTGALDGSSLGVMQIVATETAVCVSTGNSIKANPSKGARSATRDMQLLKSPVTVAVRTQPAP